MSQSKPKSRYSKKLISAISIFLVLFVIATFVVYWHTGSEPTVLIGSVFGAALTEYWALAGIKKAEIKNKCDIYEENSTNDET